MTTLIPPPAEPSTTRRRPTRLVVTVAVLLVGIAIAAAVYLAHRSSSDSGALPAWQKLPDPAVAASSTEQPYGATIGQGGGQGAGTVRVSPPAGMQSLTVNITCEGNGQLRVLSPSASLVEIRCFVGQWVGYSAGAPITGTIDQLTVEASNTMVWRIYVSAP